MPVRFTLAYRKEATWEFPETVSQLCYLANWWERLSRLLTVCFAFIRHLWVQRHRYRIAGSFWGY